MTFIASVIAKKGVAVIADSLVTSTSSVIDYNKFLNYFRKKIDAEPNNRDIKIDPREILSLFERKPSHTKDYEEKLFEYDKYTAITTAGTAIINGKRIETVINEILSKNKKDKSYQRKRIETKVKEFADFVNQEVIEHIKKHEEIGHTTFIITHYSKSKEQTFIYKVDVRPSSTKDLEVENFHCVDHRLMNEFYRVVCDGQNRISERILFGEIDFFFEIAPIIATKAVELLNVPQGQIPENFIETLMENARTVLPQHFYEDMKINKLADLSLQQAVDLATLLMKIEIDFQKYTENIPTVGGVIKLGVIDRDGFKYISGNQILKPEKLN